MKVSDKKLGPGWGQDYREKAETRIKQGLMFIQSSSHSINDSCYLLYSRYIARPEKWQWVR